MNAYLWTKHRQAALLCATIDQEDILTLVNAGCTSPLWWHSAHEHVEDLRSQSRALGLNVDTAFDEKSIALAANDTLVLCTGSLVSISDGTEQFGQHRLVQALNQAAGCPASELATAIMDQVSAFGAQEQDDRQSHTCKDIVVAIFRRTAKASQETEDAGTQSKADASGA
jgi:serine phosphatase RsbU (regulator of sigma subunit)